MRSVSNFERLGTSSRMQLRSSPKAAPTRCPSKQDSTPRRHKGVVGRLAAVLFSLSIGAAAQSAEPDTPTPLLVGFNIGGFGWARPETQGVKDPKELAGIIEELGYLEASMIHAMGGNAMRIFYAPSSFGQPGFSGEVAFQNRTIQNRLERIDLIDEQLTAALAGLPEDKTFRQKPIDWLWSDAYLDGVARFNTELAQEERIRVLLTQVSHPPRAIIECPSNATLRYFKRSYTFETLWTRYVDMNVQMSRKLIRRYLTRYPADAPLIIAVELDTEGDYWWIPGEMKIERSEASDASPMDKYITELRLGQIPVNDHINKAYERGEFGHREQDVEWDHKPATTPLLEFNWGRKFDRYVRYFTKLQKAQAEGIADEAREVGQHLEIISAAVTNVNVDYLIRMYREDPMIFEGVDAIGLHPYHWPQHQIWDTNYVSDAPTAGWSTVSPREFALKYYKRFDFLKEVTRLSRMSDPSSSYGMAGKRLWVTEFGIPTKKLGKVNDPLRTLDGHFIYERGDDVPEDIDAAVWEDLWDAFLDQVDRDFLVSNRVEAFFFFFLREGISDSSNDDYSSNLSMIDRNGNHRLDAPTQKRFEAFIRSLTLK